MHASIPCFGIERPPLEGCGLRQVLGLDLAMPLKSPGADAEMVRARARSAAARGSGRTDAPCEEFTRCLHRIPVATAATNSSAAATAQVTHRFAASDSRRGSRWLARRHR